MRLDQGHRTRVDVAVGQRSTNEGRLRFNAWHGVTAHATAMIHCSPPDYRVDAVTVSLSILKSLEQNCSDAIGRNIPIPTVTKAVAVAVI